MLNRRSLRIAAGAAAVILLGLAYMENWHAGLIGRLGFVEAPEPYPFGAEDNIGRNAAFPPFIAHGGGECEGLIYTNSFESVEASLQKGYRFIELDLRRTIDGHYYGAHKTSDFNKRTGRAWRMNIPPTLDFVREAKLDGMFRPVVLADLPPLFEKYPDAVLVVDKATDYAQLLEEFPLNDRMIVETGSVEDFYAARMAGIRYPALNTHDFELAMRHGVKIVVTSVSSAMRDKAAAFRAADSIILAATVSDCATLVDRPEVLESASLVYTDRCGPFRKDVFGNP